MGYLFFYILIGLIAGIFINRCYANYVKLKNRYYKFINKVYYKEELSNDEFINLVTQALLGDDYYIVDPVNGPQGNLIIYKDIINKYLKH